METNQNRFVYLDNIRNFLVYNVVLFHVLLMFAYPLLFWWPVIDKERSSGFLETSIVSMDIYMMPCLLFVAALFIFPSLNKITTLEYIKKRFLRLCVPVIIYLFCAGDISSHLILKRLNSVNPNYLETFRNFWQAFVNLPGIYISSSEKTLNAVIFNFQHTWFLTLLFFITLVVILLSLPFKRKNSEQIIVDSKKKIIFKILIFAVAFSIANTAALLYYFRHGIIGGSWLIAGKAVQFQIDHIWTLLTMFLFGLYMYKKGWLTRGDIGNWKMWGVMAFIFLALYILIFHISVLPMLE